MYCGNCGKEIAQDMDFCPSCGASVSEQEQTDSFSNLVSRAKQGDQDALTILYQKSYNQVFFTVKSMIRDENTVYDLLQDSYMKAFTHLKDLDTGAKFLPWVRQIAANTARDYLKKKKPTLFAELTSDDGPDAPIEERFVDQNRENLPDEVIDQAETVRLVREIIDSLPGDQRAVIGMYYYQEMSVKEIAAALEVSENTVKSRLLYARRKIEAKVQDLEKKGTKLYGLAPMPFLLWLLRSQQAQSAPMPNGQILQNVLEKIGSSAAPAGASSAAGTGQTAAAQTAATKTAAAAKMAGSLSAFKVGMIALASVAVIGAGVFGITQLRQQPDHTEQTVQTPDETPDETPTETETTPVYEPSEEEIDAALNLYFDIISSAPEHFPADSGAAPTGKYRYSITPTSLSDQIQTLLLGQETEDGNYQVRLFQYDFETESMIQPERILDEILTGDAEHAELTRMEGNVILLTQTSQRSGDAEISALALDGEELELESQWSGNADKVPERLASTEIHWTEISFDLSQYTPSQQDSSDGQTSTQEQTSSGGQSQPQQLPEEEGRIVFTGTIDTFTYDEIVQLQGQPDPNAPWSDPNQTMRLIVLDTPQEMTLQSGDPMGSPRSGLVKLISVKNVEGLEQYDGQHLTFSIDPTKTYWPSDTSLPLGQPSTWDLRVLQ